MKRLLQHSLHYRCGHHKIVARGLCGVCYTLRGQDGRYFGALREAVLARDGGAAGYATARSGASERSSCITGCWAARILRRCSRSARAAMQG